MKCGYLMGGRGGAREKAIGLDWIGFIMGEMFWLGCRLNVGRFIFIFLVCTQGKWERAADEGVSCV